MVEPRVFENTLLERIFGLKRDDMKGGSREHLAKWGWVRWLARMAENCVQGFAMKTSRNEINTKTWA
jgi:hypothetical protein